MANKKIKKNKVNSSQHKQRKLSPIAKLICFIIIGISCYMLYLVGQEVLTTVQLKQQLADVQTKLDEVKAENEYLTEQKAKLEDPNYVESYARANYMLSKEGEQIFYLPEDDSK